MLVNLTPHAVTLLAADGTEFDSHAKCYRLSHGATPLVLAEIPSSGVARCAVAEEEQPFPETIPLGDGTFAAVPLIGVAFGDVEGLPAPQHGVLYIVSAIVANAARAQGRDDVVVPARMVRDGAGRIIGCLALAIR